MGKTGEIQGKKILTTSAFVTIMQAHTKAVNSMGTIKYCEAYKMNFLNKNSSKIKVGLYHVALFIMLAFIAACSSSGDSGSGAASAIDVSSGTAVTGRIDSIMDEDWYKFDALSGSGYEFKMTPDTLSSATLTLYNANDEVLMSLQVTKSSKIVPLNSATISTSYTWECSANGTYYISVLGNNATGSYSIEVISNGNGENKYYKDNDGDSYGDPEVTITASSQPTGFVANNTDCDDSDATIYPGATEVCGDSIDQDCDGSDKTCDTGGDTTVYTFYADSDSDTYGNPNTTTFSNTNSAPAGYVADNTDCDDSDATIHPGATEICNDGIDQDCDGSDYTTCVGTTTQTYYQDSDGDGYGDSSVSVDDTSKPAGYVLDKTDCDDSDATIHPGATEICDNGVDNNCDGDKDGVNIPNAFATIQEGLDAVTDGCTVFVKAGTYYENLDFKGKSVTLKSVSGAANTIIDGGNKAPVITMNTGEGATTLIDDLTIQNGKGSDLYVDGTLYGGGFLISGASPIITNCIVTNNSADVGAGFFIVANSAPQLSKCDINTNTAADFGGGIAIKASDNVLIAGCDIKSNLAADGAGVFIDSSTTTISKAMIQLNKANSKGGGICVINSATATITDTDIIDNDAQHGAGVYVNSATATIATSNIKLNQALNDGGGINSDASSTVTITDSKIRENDAENGGGVYCNSSTVSISRAYINHNTATSWGGGLYLSGAASSGSTVTNCNIYNNSATSSYSDGGGIFCNSAAPTIVNCTIVNNSASDNGGGIECNTATPVVLNSLFWGNSAANNGNQVSLSGSGGIDITFSNIEGGYVGASNINADPVLDGNNHLSTGSPCIDAGTATGAPTLDIDNESRPNGAGHDIGADELY